MAGLDRRWRREEGVGAEDAGKYRVSLAISGKSSNPPAGRKNCVKGLSTWRRTTEGLIPVWRSKDRKEDETAKQRDGEETER